MKIFGKEPAFWVGAIQGLLMLLLSFHTIADKVGLGGGNGDEIVGLIVAVTSAGFGVYTAWVTRDTMLSYLIGFTKALIALLVAYNVELTAEQAAGILGIITIASGLIHRDRTAPLVTPMFKNAPNAPVMTEQQLAA